MEQIKEVPHKIKGFNAVAHEAFIRECAHEIIQANKASAEVAQKHLTDIRAKLAAKAPVKKPMFSTSRLRELAANRRAIAKQFLSEVV